MTESTHPKQPTNPMSKRKIRWIIIIGILVPLTAVIVIGAIRLHPRSENRDANGRRFTMRMTNGETASVEVYWRKVSHNNRNPVVICVWRTLVTKNSIGLFGEEDRQLVDVFVESGDEYDLMVFKYADGASVPHKMTNYIPERLDGKHLWLGD